VNILPEQLLRMMVAQIILMIAKNLIMMTFLNLSDF